MSDQRGQFIVLCGGEGAGKTTIRKRLEDALFGKNVFFTREPGGSGFAEEVRTIFLAHRTQPLIPFEQLLLIEAARSHHVRTIIEPTLRDGAHVICDRFNETTYIYQIVAGGGGAELEHLMNVLEKSSIGNTQPDLYIFLDVNPQTGIERKRMSEDTMNVFDLADLSFHEEARKAQQEFLKDKNYVVVDTNTLDVEQSYQAVCDILKEHVAEELFDN